MNSILGDRFVFPGHKALLFADEPACNVDEQRARLAGVRTLVWNESSKDRVMDVASMQMLSGGDTFNAKPMYGRATTVVPRFLPVLATNWLPRLPQVKQSTIDRPVVVSFPVYFKNMTEGETETSLVKRVDRDLAHKAVSIDGGTAVLKWLVDGAVRYYAEPGYLHEKVPQSFKELKTKWLEEQDHLESFIRTRCMTDPAYFVEVTRFRALYIQHFTERVSGADLKKSMGEKGFDYRTARPTRDKYTVAACYVGLCFREDVEPGEETEGAQGITQALESVEV